MTKSSRKQDDVDYNPNDSDANESDTEVNESDTDIVPIIKTRSMKRLEKNKNYIAKTVAKAVSDVLSNSSVEDKQSHAAIIDKYVSDHAKKLLDKLNNPIQKHTSRKRKRSYKRAISYSDLEDMLDSDTDGFSSTNSVRSRINRRKDNIIPESPFSPNNSLGNQVSVNNSLGNQVSHNLSESQFLPDNSPESPSSSDNSLVPQHSSKDPYMEFITMGPST